MKKIVVALSFAMILPTMANACTYDHIQLRNGEVQARWIPCNDESCSDYQRHKKMIQNQKVHIHDISPAEAPKFDSEKKNDKANGNDSKEQKERSEAPTSDAGRVYDKNTHKERDVNAINAENDAINRITGQTVTIVEAK